LGKERKFVWGEQIVFGQSCFCMSRGRTRKKKSSRAGTTMEGKFWSLFGVVEY
jgi:hypothetical protein